MALRPGSTAAAPRWPVPRVSLRHSQCDRGRDKFVIKMPLKAEFATTFHSSPCMGIGKIVGVYCDCSYLYGYCRPRLGGTFFLLLLEGHKRNLNPFSVTTQVM